MRIDDINERRFYEIEAYKNNWSLKELERQYNSALYTRLALSRDKDKVLELAEKGLVHIPFYPDTQSGIIRTLFRSAIFTKIGIKNLRLRDHFPH
jgi:hypothetical protein